MIVDGRRRARRDDQGEQAQRAVFGPVQSVLTDAAAHAAATIRLGVLLRQPAFRREELSEGRPERDDPFCVAGDLRHESADFGGVHDETEAALVLGIAEVTHSNALQSARPQEPRRGRMIGWKRSPRCRMAGAVGKSGSAMTGVEQQQIGPLAGLDRTHLARQARRSRARCRRLCSPAPARRRRATSQWLRDSAGARLGQAGG